MTPSGSKADLVRKELLSRILSGQIPDGTKMPTERALEEEFWVSRVTIRRALDDLKHEGIVSSIRGSGTTVTLRKDPYGGSLRFVVVAAPVYEGFFAAFLGQFQRVAATHGTTVVFTQEGEQSTLATPNFYLPFLERDIRDFVIWPRWGVQNPEMLSRLRGVGANIVFFDHSIFTRDADCVSLDNVHAIHVLCERLALSGHRNIHYLGWEGEPLSANAERESAFLRSDYRIHREVTRIPRASDVQHELARLLDHLIASDKLPDAFVCVSRDMGLALCNVYPHFVKESVAVAVVDEMPDIYGIPMICVPQPLEDLAAQAYECLRQQNDSGRAKRAAKRWQAQRYTLRGQIHESEAFQAINGRMQSGPVW